VKVVPGPLASAIGAGLDISLPYAQMLIDIGEGVADVAVIRSRQLILTSVVRKACGDLRAALQQVIAQRDDVFIDPHQAERLLQESGVSDGTMPCKTLRAFGVDRQGCKRKIELSGHEIADATKPVVSEIVKTIMQTVGQVTLELAVEIMESGICLAGGGANLRGLDDLIKSKTSIDVKIAVDPLHAAINGLSQMLMTSPEACLWESRI
jgi:rod shape-determining protein MreB